MATKKEVVAVEVAVESTPVVAVESLPVKTSKLVLPTFESTAKATRDNALYNGVCVTTHILKNNGLPVVRFFNGIGTVSRRFGELRRDNHTIYGMDLVSTEPKSLTVIECCLLGLCKQSILQCDLSRNAVVSFLQANGKELTSVINELRDLGANNTILNTLEQDLMQA